jgi:hypothetical protein
MRASTADRVRALDASFLPLPRFEALAGLCLAAARAACGRDLRGAMVHGSCLPAELGGKGGFIPGFSDFDFHAYLDPARMRGDRACTVETALALQRAFTAVQTSAAPTAPVQLFCVNATRLPRGWSLPEGAHRVLYGIVPPLPAEPAPARAQALARLRGCRRDAAAITASVCDKTDAGMQGTVRSCASMLKGALPHAAVLDGAGAEAVWLWPLSRVVLEAAPLAGAGAEALAFWGELTDWEGARRSPERLRGMVLAAVTALDRLADFAERREAGRAAAEGHAAGSGVPGEDWGPTAS